jgi:hypothetical protein
VERIPVWVRQCRQSGAGTRSRSPRGAEIAPPEASRGLRSSGEIRKREARKREIDRLLNRPTIDRAGLHRALEARLHEWKRLLRPRPTHGQTVLRALLDGPITIGAPKGNAVPWQALGGPEGLLGGILSTKLASPMPASWNQIVSWLRQIDGLRAA